MNSEKKQGVDMATELEIKLSVSETAQARAIHWLSALPEARPGKKTSLVNRYYDTPDAALNQAKAALRVRKAGDVYIQTLKTRGEFVDGAHRREEWEWTLPGPDLDLALLEETPLHGQIDLGNLTLLFETNFQRQVYWLEDEGDLIEVAVDSGSILAGTESRPLHEIEFELKEGDGKSLTRWALNLAQQVPVFLNLVSKAEQGYYLAGCYAPDTRVPDGPLSLNSFLYFLSISWLVDRPIPVSQLDLSTIRQLAEQSEVITLFQSIMEGLTEGMRITDVLEVSKALGQFQLRLVSR
jgi:inorganic triphosphatase YgiF